LENFIMRSFQIAFAASLLLATAPAFAHHAGASGPCSAYVPACKTDASVTGAADKKAKWQAMSACVSAAAKADTANGQKCVDAQAKHEAHEKPAADAAAH
jgi:hypothetical protein